MWDAQGRRSPLENRAWFLSTVLACALLPCSPQGLISFLPGEKERVLEIKIVDDDMAEPDVTLSVVLSDLQGDNHYLTQVRPLSQGADGNASHGPAALSVMKRRHHGGVHPLAAKRGRDDCGR